MMGMMNQMGEAAQAPPTVDMSAWASMGGDASTQMPGAETDAMTEAMKATQDAIIMQQVQFQQQMKVDQLESLTRPVSGNARFTGNSRFKDDYRAFKLCMHFQTGTCWQGARCVYAHNYEELHPASPDMPEEAQPDNTAMAKTSREEEQAPVLRLR